MGLGNFNIYVWGTYVGPMGTYGDLWGTYGDLWGTYGESMRTYGGPLGDLWGIYGGSVGTYEESMGSMKTYDLYGQQISISMYGASVPDLGGYKSLVWGWPCFMYGTARLTYGDLWGCCGCGVEPMGSMGVLWLRCGAYGDLWECCSCGVGPMGLIYGASGPCSFSRFMYSIAVKDLWGSMRNPDCYCGCGLGPMGRVELRRQTYGDLW